MIFISDYSLRSKDILLLTTFSYREARGTRVYVSPLPHKKIKNKKILQKIFYKKNKKFFIHKKLKNF